MNHGGRDFNRPRKFPGNRLQRFFLCNRLRNFLQPVAFASYLMKISSYKFSSPQQHQPVQ